MVPFMVLKTSFIPIVSAAATCYYTDGSADNSDDQLACDPTATVSACCGQTDYCLSNGLCLDAGANSLLAVQGCTDPKWSSPCHAYCPSEIQLGDTMYPCANTEPASGGSVEFCCGHEATNVSTCCANGGAFSVPVGTDCFETVSAFELFGNFDIHSSGQSIQVSFENKKSLAIGLGVGLGVGIPFLLLLSALVFLGLQLKRQNKDRATPGGAPPMVSEGLPMTDSYPHVVEFAERQKLGVRNELDSQRTGLRGELDSQNQQVYEVPNQGNR
ncbi:hypothetical protein NA56DRAFT_704336 [Hyaloscypha hepaticicola]|uniref:Mid2 domain-containing protein n=1 Tax=Hyaloscypha hepaticicola TaxID=2082293 RepID=A0A2J6Q2N2_9HELO|nr:hypothetical protein NA56DRAFT_704336 [Hyaloscypha hepaticicola]